MVYDLNLIEPMQKVSSESQILQIFSECRVTKNDYDIFHLMKLFKLYTEGDNQLHRLRNDVTVTPDDLLTMPSVSPSVVLALTCERYYCKAAHFSVAKLSIQIGRLIHNNPFPNRVSLVFMLICTKQLQNSSHKIQRNGKKKRQLRAKCTV